ncbi:hypothetical protein [Kitasatospora sp. NPDC050463]|uniref:hypothetical protein n=1 Tax=Kitasatospora sp. NPDC050463 TaxID=3155786 RepID=UPI0033EAA214
MSHSFGAHRRPSATEAGPRERHGRRGGRTGHPGPARTCPETVCLPGFNSEARHFGLGVTVANGWVVQHPAFAGYAAVPAYLPVDRIAIAVTTTREGDAPGGLRHRQQAHCGAPRSLPPLG